MLDGWGVMIGLANEGGAGHTTASTTASGSSQTMNIPWVHFGCAIALLRRHKTTGGGVTTENK